MAGTIIADFIRTDANQLSLNVGNTTFATINAGGFYSNTGTRIIAANGTVSTSALSGTISTAQIANSAVTSDKISSIANTTITTGLGYTPANSKIGIDLTNGLNTPKMWSDLLFYQFSGTVYPNQVPFYASTRAQAEKMAAYFGNAFMNYIKNLENDGMFDQAHNATLVNMGIASWFPVGTLPTGTVDMDENEGAGASQVFAVEGFRVIIASNGVDKIWTWGVCKGSATDRGFNYFMAQTTNDETGNPSGYGSTILNAGMSASAWKVTEHTTSFTGASNGGQCGVLPIPFSFSLNF
jgi:hypothetical protein